MIADSLAVRYPQTAWVGLRINNVIPPDGYDRFHADGTTRAAARATSGATSTHATSVPPTEPPSKAPAPATRCV